MIITPKIPENTGGKHKSGRCNSRNIVDGNSRVCIPRGATTFVFSRSNVRGIVARPNNCRCHSNRGDILTNSNVKSLFDSITDQFAFNKRPIRAGCITFIGLHRVHNVGFNAPTPLICGSGFCNISLRVQTQNAVSLGIASPIHFIHGCIPTGMASCTFSGPGTERRVLSRFIRSFVITVGSLSSRCQVSRLPTRTGSVTAHIHGSRAGTKA